MRGISEREKDAGTAVPGELLLKMSKNQKLKEGELGKIVRFSML
jgi:hypothetical protein